MKPTEINQKYPIKNKLWSFTETTGRYSAEDSDLRANGFLDPWNRQFPPGKGREVRSDDEDNELQMWVYVTTVQGVFVECVVFND
jgi:hypothetical protein